MEAFMMIVLNVLEYFILSDILATVIKKRGKFQFVFLLAISLKTMYFQQHKSAQKQEMSPWTFRIEESFTSNSIFVANFLLFFLST